MTRVSSTIVDTHGNPVPNVFVDAQIMGPATWLNTQGAASGIAKTFTDALGTWDLDLIPQSTYFVTGTYYLIREWGVGSYTIVVPDDTGGVVNARDCLVNPPPEVSPWSPISTFDSLRDVNPANRAIGDTVTVGEDGLLEFVPFATGGSSAPNWYEGIGPPGVIVGSSLHDIYVDTLTGTFYILE